MKNMKMALVAVTAFSLMTLFGCSTPDRLVQANYSQIEANKSTESDVESLIGKPDSKLADMWIYQRPDDHLTVMIDFDASGRVTRKQWVDAIQGAWDDTNQKPKR